MAFPRLTLRFLIRLFVCGLSLGATAKSRAYNTLGPSWPEGSTIVMQLALGPTSVTLEDGSGTWDGSAAAALPAWNLKMETVQFSYVLDSHVAEAPGDGFNSVFFSDSVYGDGFGEDVLALALLFYDQNTGSTATEADVVINQAFNYNSYRGALKAGDPDTRVYDIHRIFLHEFGHVLGLAHPDEIGQNVAALMNSVITDLDHLADDDLAGAEYVYGIRFFPGGVDYSVGQVFNYPVPTNVPAVSYEAAGLPPSVTIDAKTGILSGTFALSGFSGSALITAHGQRTTASTEFFFDVAPDPPNDLRANYHFRANDLVLDKARNRVYAAVDDPPGVAVIDDISLSVLTTLPSRPSHSPWPSPRTATRFMSINGTTQTSIPPPQSSI